MSLRMSPHMSPWRRTALGLLLPLLALALWWAAFEYRWTDSILMVPASQVWASTVALSASGELWASLGHSLWRYASGLAIGAVLGLAVGVLIGQWPLFRQLVGPSLHTVKHVSMFAWIPLIMVWFGLGETSRLVFIAAASFFPVVLNTIEGVAGVPQPLHEVARVLCLSRRQVFLRLVLPAALPSIFTGLHLALIYAWLSTLGAEYLLTSSTGLGNLLVEGRENLWIDQVLVGIVVVGSIGFALNALAAAAEARLLRWRGPAGTGS